MGDQIPRLTEVSALTNEHDRKHDKSTGGSSPDKVEAGLVGPAADLSALAPEILRLPGREPIDVRGLSVGDVIGMIRDDCGAPDPADLGVSSVEAGPTREHIEEERPELPSEPLSPDDVVFTEETTPSGRMIIGLGDDKGDHGFIVEETVRPSDQATLQTPEGETGISLARRPPSSPASHNG